jgi:hypothetical protein
MSSLECVAASDSTRICFDPFLGDGRPVMMSAGPSIGKRCTCAGVL